nr:neuroglobin-like [Leptinotarsa decemlineata]
MTLRNNDGQLISICIANIAELFTELQLFINMNVLTVSRIERLVVNDRSAFINRGRGFLTVKDDNESYQPKMGLIMSLLGYRNTGRTDDPDPQLGLTSRDKYLLKNSWETVMKDSTGNGVKFFMRLFEIQPKYHQAFPFRNISRNDLPSNKKFQAHCNSVMYSIGSLIGVMEDSAVFSSLAERIGIAHASRGVDIDALKDVKTALVDTLSFMQQEELEAWNKFLDVMIRELYKPIKECGEEKQI